MRWPNSKGLYIYLAVDFTLNSPKKVTMHCVPAVRAAATKDNVEKSSVRFMERVAH